MSTIDDRLTEFRGEPKMPHWGDDPLGRFTPGRPPESIKPPADETVDHPPYYGGDTAYEVIKVLKAWGFLFNAHRFNAIKYLARAGKKPTSDMVRDLEAAVWYINDEIKEIKEQRGGR